MSEEILNAIIQLLAIVAKEDDVTSDEIASIEHFLGENLDEKKTKHYLKLFEDLTKSATKDEGQEKVQIDEICLKINHELTAQQKVVIILDLLILIAADGQVSDRENELLYYISEKLNINKRITDLIKAFVIYQERNRIVSGNVLIVDNGEHEVPDKCKHLTRENFPGFVFILRIPEIEIYFAKYLGEHDLVLNGNAMRSQRIYNFSSGSVIKSGVSSPIYHSEIVNEFRQIASEHHLTFTARNISYKFKNGKMGLRNINVEEESGRLVALMGGSGAGKSTLLNVLNGNETPSEGTVKINGVDIHKEKDRIEGVIGYVPQDDLLIEELTVFDNLFYAAKLCFKDHSDADIVLLVTKTLEDLGLYETRKLRVGTPLDKTISGGQRKRLNIGLELLREPSVMFIDEPTSGLSSRDSENIMDLLKELTLKGKMIFVVIHQPSEEIFKMFDKLIILDVGGYQIYYGNPVESISYFKDIVKMVNPDKSVNPEQIFHIIESKVVNEFGNFTNQRKVTPYQWYEHFKTRITVSKVKDTDIVPHKTLHIPNKLKQLFIFTIRDLKAKVSNRQYMVVNFLEAPVLALLLAFIVFYVPEDTHIYQFKKNLNIPVYFFMSVIVALFMGLTVSAEEIIRDRKILKREAFLNLSRLSYLLSKILILFGLSAIQTLTFVLIGNWFLEMYDMTLSMWMILFSVSCFANVLGLNVSSAFKSAITVYVLIPLLIIPQLILSGVVVQFDKLNPKITSEDKVPIMGEVMASRWAFEGLMVAQFTSNAYERNFYEQDKIMAQSEFKTIYLIPRIESDLEYAHLGIQNQGEDSAAYAYHLKTIQNELSKELSKIGKDHFPDIEKINYTDFNLEVYNSTRDFIKKLKDYHNRRFKKASEEKQATLTAFLATPDGKEEFNQLRIDHENDMVSILTRNLTTEHRILEHKNELIQKLYPVYLDPEFPSGPLDFRAQFFQPTKHIFGVLIPTPIFNTGFIWFMTLILWILLYYDVFKKIMNLF